MLAVADYLDRSVHPWMKLADVAVGAGVPKSHRSDLSRRDFLGREESLLGSRGVRYGVVVPPSDLSADPDPDRIGGIEELDHPHLRATRSRLVGLRWAGVTSRLPVAAPTGEQTEGKEHQHRREEDLRRHRGAPYLQGSRHLLSPSPGGLLCSMASIPRSSASTLVAPGGAGTARKVEAARCSRKRRRS